MKARVFITGKLDDAKAKRALLDAEISTLEMLLAEIPVEVDPGDQDELTSGGESNESLTQRDQKRATRIEAIAKLLADGPRGQGAICDALDCSDPTTIAILKICPYFERDGNSRFAPWKLSQKGSLFLGSILGAKP